MPFNLSSAFGIHEQALLVRAKRAEVLAQNLANADTPGYKAQDIDFAAALSQASSMNDGLAATHATHIKGFNETGMEGVMLQYRMPLQPSIDGDTVDSHLEKARFTENAIQYETSLTFLDGKIKSLLRAIRGE